MKLCDITLPTDHKLAKRGCTSGQHEIHAKDSSTLKVVDKFSLGRSLSGAPLSYSNSRHRKEIPWALSIS